MPSWTRLADPATDAALLPAWFVERMLGSDQGSFGLLLTTGDVLRVAGLRAAHLSSDGTILLDLTLDHAGVPAMADTAWQSKHYLGAPVPGAVQATVNLAQVVCAVEFQRSQTVGRPQEEEAMSATVVELRQAAEDATERQSVA
ncbi:hypothetical protein [Belnapia rosea]|uniref:hypothetical protein n=1 Tax=Belnapia rosea TaxID=938405 RepID=UPI0008808BA4|nr:hypothetical protein [Belnapia rosea]SDB49381.1 hypothetical protein SAMN02927895_01895 [Belnapia rosea]